MDELNSSLETGRISVLRNTSEENIENKKNNMIIKLLHPK